MAFIIGISRGITVLMNDGRITDTILHWGEAALSGLGAVPFVLLVYLIYLPLSVFIRVTDDDEIRAINREQRGKDAATDVLSFPTVNYPAGKTAGACEALLREEFDPDTDACAIGDIVISMDHVRAQAAEYGHSERRECGYLLTHGLFHLMGYDHMTEAEKPVMRAMEEKALASIGLTREE